jgi:hypothetical protein
LDCSLKDVLTASLQDVGADAACAVQFAGQMESTLQMVDNTGSLVEAFGILNRELITQVPDLRSGAASDALVTPTLPSVVRLAHEVALLGGPSDGASLSPADDAIGVVDQFTNMIHKKLSSVKKLCRRGLEERGVCTLPESVHEAIDKVLPASRN